jgi:hypothetical protein
MAKEKERLAVLELRRMGWSIPCILRKIKVSKGTALRWCQEVQLTDQQLAAIKTEGHIRTAQAKKQEKATRCSLYQNEGLACAANSDDPLLLVGAALYWGEGTKKSEVMLANSDLRIIKIYIKWLLKCFSVDPKRLRYQINIPKIFDETEIKEYWTEQLKDLVSIDQGQWYKTQIAKAKMSYKKHESYKGTIYIRLHDTNLLYKIEGILKGLQEKLL